MSRCGTGMDNVDLEFAKSRDILVVNTPFGPTRSVAELTLGLILDLLRQMSRMDRELRSGIWKKRMGRLLLGKKIGIVGMGRIGQAVTDMLVPLGTQIAYTDPNYEHTNFRRMSLIDLLSWADIITLHCSKPKGEKPLLSETELSRMAFGSLLINAGRGGLVDEDALYKLLKSGHLSGAALDCFGREPYIGPLSTLENVILTPHIGSYAREGRVQMEMDAVKNLINALGL
ncbi:MAG: NAD(P)-dependent oxidoreductase [Thermodesulfobacteriota bacterium]|nr:NAD(P)-dependent oxidoreductase [Thermodesulfobacteriota bacterium]